MAKKHSTNRRAPDPKDEIHEGSKLAIVMLRELEANPELRDGCYILQDGPAPQDNIVLRYLETCRCGGPSMEMGFCAVLSDLVAIVSDGMVPSAATYQSTLKSRVPGRVRAAAKKRRAWKVVQHIAGVKAPTFSDAEFARRARARMPAHLQNIDAPSSEREAWADAYFASLSAIAKAQEASGEAGDRAGG